MAKAIIPLSQTDMGFNNLVHRISSIANLGIAFFTFPLL